MGVTSSPDELRRLAGELKREGKEVPTGEWSSLFKVTYQVGLSPAKSVADPRKTFLQR
jgi:hypothetical protein